MHGDGAVSATDVVRRCTMGANAGSVPLWDTSAWDRARLLIQKPKIVCKELGKEGRKRHVRESPAQNREKEL